MLDENKLVSRRGSSSESCSNRVSAWNATCTGCKISASFGRLENRSSSIASPLSVAVFPPVTTHKSGRISPALLYLGA